MDKEQARFILRSFRPDGADVGDADFASALQLALEDRELGEWLADERSSDAAFANALASTELPSHLRENILVCLAAGRGDFPQVADAFDATLVGAFASIQPPAGLRDRVLSAMDRTVVPAPQKSSFLRRFSVPLAAAAGIALAFFVTRQSPPEVVAKSAGVPIEAVRAGFVRTFESPAFALDMKRADPELLVNHLRQRKLPCPKAIPAGLRNFPSLGCRELEVGGRRGSLMCFDLGEDGLVHMVIFRREDVLGDFPENGREQIIRRGDWTSTRWADGHRVYLVMSHVSPERLATLL